MDDKIKEAIEKLVKDAFHNGDIAAHKRHHAEEEERLSWYKQLWRRLLERAAMAVLTVIGGWAVYALWSAFKGLLK